MTVTAPDRKPTRPPIAGGTAHARHVRAVIAEQDDAWRDKAACNGHPRPDIFYPPPARADDGDVDLSGINQSRRERRRKIIVAEAKSVCNACPVTDECLAFGDAIGDYHGIWGGLTARERGRKRDER